jgi:membrane-bound lytic murein transglycosylase B
MNRRIFIARALCACGAVLMLAIGGAARANPELEPFPEFLANLRTDALLRGISQATVALALTDVELVPRVVELDRKQPEFTQTLSEYLEKRVTDDLIAEGKQLLQENQALLARIHAKYGLQPRFLVALWGIETKYGRYTGSFGVIPALVTLAYDNRRRDRFREELFDALRIVDQGDIALTEMTGSWAGAMGQTQFMPSVFVKFAVDFDGDGKKDIWNSKSDIFASAANYLSQSGWKGDETWGREVKLPPGFDVSLADPFDRQHSHEDFLKSLGEWQSLGVRDADGHALPSRDLQALLILPDGPDGKAYLVYGNFRVLMTWNPAFLFAVTVGTLADRLEDR